MLLRFDPFREVDRWADEALGRLRSQVRLPAVPMDAYRRGDDLVVSFDLPGVEPAEVELTVDNNVLTVKAERHWTKTEGDEVLAQERGHGVFTRQLLLGDDLDPERISARHEHGVLTVTIPVAERSKPRRVEVTSGAASIDAAVGHQAA